MAPVEASMDRCYKTITRERSVTLTGAPAEERDLLGEKVLFFVFDRGHIHLLNNENPSRQKSDGLIIIQESPAGATLSIYTYDNNHKVFVLQGDKEHPANKLLLGTHQDPESNLTTYHGNNAQVQFRDKNHKPIAQIDLNYTSPLNTQE